MRRFEILVHWTATISLCVASFFVVGPVAAQDSALPRDYTVAIEAAVAAASESRWEEARTAFEEAHALYPNARTQRGLGIVSFQMQDYVAAYRHLLASLLEKRRPLTPEQDAEVRNYLRKAEALVGRYTTRHLPSDATFTVGGEARPLEESGVLLLPLGKHEVVVEAGQRETAATIEVTGGEVGPLDLSFPQAPEESSPPPAEAEEPKGEPPAPAPSPEALGHESTTPSRIPVATIAAGGALLVSGAVLFIVGRSDVSRVEKASTGTEWDALSKRNDRAPLFTGVGGALMGIGAITAGTGVYFHLTRESEASGPTGASLGVGGVW